MPFEDHPRELRGDRADVRIFLIAQDDDDHFVVGVALDDGTEAVDPAPVGDQWPVEASADRPAIPIAPLLRQRERHVGREHLVEYRAGSAQRAFLAPRPVA